MAETEYGEPPEMQEEHPRHHALTIAAAKHLHKMRYISNGQHKTITGGAKAKLKAHAQTKLKPFGGLAP